MTYYDQFPIDAPLLSKYRAQANKQMRSAKIGAHVRMQQGLSLEFREFRDYTPGDDYRYIDWPASARVGGPLDWIVRSYRVEQQLKIAISIDNREEFDLPVDNPKMRIGFWVAQAIAMIGVGAGDEVLMHRLFGSAGSLRKFRGRDSNGLREYFNASEKSRVGDELNIAELEGVLPTTAIWVIVTDFYGPTSAKLAQFIARKQQGYRWVIVLELNSWPTERQLLAAPTRVESSRLGPGTKLEVALDPGIAADVERRIDDRRREFFRIAQRGSLDYSRWEWEAAAPEDVGKWFLQRFISDPVLMRIFGTHGS